MKNINNAKTSNQYMQLSSHSAGLFGVIEAQSRLLCIKHWLLQL